MSSLVTAQVATPVGTSSSTGPALLAPGRGAYLRLADEMEATLRKDVLDAWFPRTIDTAHGGFRSDFARDWSPSRSGGKFSVFQARMTWISAQVAMRRPELRERFLPYVAHGVAFLDGVMWDARYGGFYWGLDDDGQISSYYSDRKQLYGIAFCIYAAAAAHEATRDPKALDLAQRAFRWTEQHAHDAENGGYHELLQRDGSLVPPTPATLGIRDATVQPFPTGFKSMNTHIHLLEAFAQLYRVWKDDLVRQRLEELLAIVRDEISVEPGVMNLYFTSDWHAVPDHDSYGHDVEAGYLMIEAAEVLGRPHDPKTERMARMLVDHALAYGWDRAQGGFFREGTTFGKPEDRHKEWWVQFEGLNALLLMHERYGQETGAYFDAFQRQWRFIKERQIDSEHGGVYEMVGPDGAPSNPGKGRIWKAAYHDGRSLLNVGERLRQLAKQSGDWKQSGD
jgi:mannobiose 2-epimerase